MIRWTLAGSLVGIAAIAVGIEAFRASTQVWAAIAPIVAGGAFALAAAIAIARRGRDRGLSGFAGIGGAYFLAAVALPGLIGPLPLVTPLIDEAGARVGPLPPPIREATLPSREWMKLPPEERQARALIMNQDSERDRAYRVEMKGRRESSRRIGHSLIALALGLVGASAARLAFGDARSAHVLPTTDPGRRYEGADAPCP